MTRDGQVTVRENGQDTSVKARGLEAPILVDVDGDTPTAHLPPGVDIAYHEGGNVAPDGGQLVPRAEVEADGFGLDESDTNRLAALSVLLFAGTGYFAHGGRLVTTVLLLLAAFATGILSRRSLRSGPA